MRIWIDQSRTGEAYEGQQTGRRSMEEKKDEVIGSCQAMPRPWKRDVDSIR